MLSKELKNLIVLASYIYKRFSVISTIASFYRRIVFFLRQAYNNSLRQNRPIEKHGL